MMDMTRRWRVQLRSMDEDDDSLLNKELECLGWPPEGSNWWYWIHYLAKIWGVQMSLRQMWPPPCMPDFTQTVRADPAVSASDETISSEDNDTGGQAVAFKALLLLKFLCKGSENEAGNPKASKLFFFAAISFLLKNIFSRYDQVKMPVSHFHNIYAVFFK